MGRIFLQKISLELHFKNFFDSPELLSANLAGGLEFCYFVILSKELDVRWMHKFDVSVSGVSL